MKKASEIQGKQQFIDTQSYEDAEEIDSEIGLNQAMASTPVSVTDDYFTEPPTRKTQKAKKVETQKSHIDDLGESTVVWGGLALSIQMLLNLNPNIILIGIALGVAQHIIFRVLASRNA